jgi:hypothetical protein
MNTKIIKLLSLLVLTMVLFSCSNSSSTTPTPAPSTNTTNVQKGNWKITLYTKKGIDETNSFTAYTFTFNSTGGISATNGTKTVSGTWADGTDDSKTELIFDFGTTSPFDELSEDWTIIENTSTKLNLQHVSGGNGGTSQLTFERL